MTKNDTAWCIDGTAQNLTTKLRQKQNQAHMPPKDARWEEVACNSEV